MKIKISILLIILLTSVDPAQGQRYSQQLVLSGGGAILASPEMITEYHSQGFTLSAGYGHYLNSKLEIRGSARFQRLGVDKRALKDKAQLPTGGLFKIQGKAAYIFSTHLELISYIKASSPIYFPYLSGGIGFSLIRSEEAALFMKNNRLALSKKYYSNAVSLSWGAGYNVYVNKSFSLNVDLKYLVSFSIHTSTKSFLIQLGTIFSL